MSKDELILKITALAINLEAPPHTSAAIVLHVLAGALSAGHEDALAARVQHFARDALGGRRNG